MTRRAKLANLNRPGLLAAVGVTLWPLVYFYPAVLGRMSLVPNDGVLQNTPLRVAAFGMLWDGGLPLWNPYIFCGMPLHAAAQAGVLFPLNWFYLFLSPYAAGNLMTISAYSAAALGSYLFARRAGACAAAGAMTALIYSSCGFLVGQLSHVNVVQTAAMLPWVLWAVDGYGGGRGRRWGALAAAFVALQAFAGHQQTFAYSLLLASAYALTQALAPGGARRRYLSALALLAVGVLLAAVQILPTLELLRNSLRSAASYDFFTSFSLSPRLLPTFVAPYVFGGGDGHLFGAPYLGPNYFGEFAAYVGAGGLALAALGASLGRDARTWFWAAVVVTAYALALGRHWPLGAYGVVYHVPLLNLFRVPARHLMEVDFALAVLAGRGVTALAAAADRARAARRALAAGVGVLALACAAVTVGRPLDLRLADGVLAAVGNAPELFAPIVAAALSACVLWLYARRGGLSWAALLLAVVALDLALFGHATGWRATSPKPDDEAWRVPPPLAVLRERADFGPGAGRLLTVQHAFDPGRKVAGAAPAPGIPFWLQPDAYMMHGAENAAGYEGFGLARYSRMAGDMKVWGELTDPERSLRGAGREIDLLNVRYLLAPAGRRATAPPVADPGASAVTGTTESAGVTVTTEPAGAAGAASAEASPRWKFLTEAGGVAVYENTRALPRAWLAPESFAATGGAALRTIRTGRLPDGGVWDPLRTALVTSRRKSEPPPGANAGRADFRGAVVVTRHEPNRVELKAEAAAPAVLVLAENYYPGWRAYLDGRAVETLRVNYGQRGVALPAGAHEVVFIYRPWSAIVGLLVTLLAALLLTIWARGWSPRPGRFAAPHRLLGEARSYLSSRKR